MKTTFWWYYALFMTALNALMLLSANIISRKKYLFIIACLVFIAGILITRDIQRRKKIKTSA